MRARNHLPLQHRRHPGRHRGGRLASLAQRKSSSGICSPAAPQQASGVMTYARDTEHIEKAFIFGGMPRPLQWRDSPPLCYRAADTGVDDVFVGDGNFLAAFADSARAQELTAELGSRYEVSADQHQKYCVGFPIQSAIEGLLGLMAEHQLRADQVERITARLPESGAAP